MNKTLSLQDLILISSYLDDRLSPGDKARVQTRLEQDQSFRAAFEEMRYTRRVLRSLPQRRAPRNFTLSPKMFPQRQPLRLQPVFGFTSAVAAVLMILVFAGSQFLPGILSTRATEAPMMAAAPEAQLTTKDSARNATEPTAIPPLVLWNGSEYVPGGQEIASGMGGGSGQPLGIGGGGAGGSGLPSSTELPADQAPSAAELAAANPDTLILGIAPKTEQGTELSSPEASVPPASPKPLGITLLLEIIFGGLAVISAVLAVLLRRRS